MAHKKTIMPKAPLGPPIILFLLTTAITTSLIFFTDKLWAALFIALVALVLPFVTYNSVIPFHGLILINNLTGSMRAIFPGFNLIWPWEEPEKENGKPVMRDLRVEFEEVVKDTYITSGGPKMEVSYVFTFRANLQENPSRNVVLFYSFEPNAIKTKGKGVFSQIFSDYYRSKTLEDMFKTSKPEIESATIGSGAGQSRVASFNIDHGAETSVILTDSDLDEKTQEFYVKVAQSDAIGKQFANYKAQKISRKDAQRLIELANFDTVTYDHDEITLVIKAEDLKNLQSFNFTPFGQMGTGGKQRKRKATT